MIRGFIKTDHLLVYDCGHTRHAEEVISFLKKHSKIKNVDIVISHNDTDHTAGIELLMTWLSKNVDYTINLYAHLYLKYTDEILDCIDDGRRSPERLKEALLEEYNNIASIIQSAKQFGFTIIEAQIHLLLTAPLLGRRLPSSFRRLQRQLTAE